MGSKFSCSHPAVHPTQPTDGTCKSASPSTLSAALRSNGSSESLPASPSAATAQTDAQPRVATHTQALTASTLSQSLPATLTIKEIVVLLCKYQEQPALICAVCPRLEEAILALPRADELLPLGIIPQLLACLRCNPSNVQVQASVCTVLTALVKRTSRDLLKSALRSCNDANVTILAAERCAGPVLPPLSLAYLDAVVSRL